MVTRLKVKRIELIGIMQGVVIDQFEVVCGASYVVPIRRVCYIATHQGVKLDFDTY